MEYTKGDCESSGSGDDTIADGESSLQPMGNDRDDIREGRNKKWKHQGTDEVNIESRKLNNQLRE